MVEYVLDETLSALADPTRRAMLARLSQGEARVTELARPFPMSLNAVSKHIRMLERARLVQRRVSGRDHFLSLNLPPMDEAAAWLEGERRAWAWRLEALGKALEEEDDMSEVLTTLTVFHAYRQSAERVFDAWLDPKTASKFLFATPTGAIIACEIDARVGGRFRIIDRRPEGDAEHFGEFIELDRPRRIAFDFWVPEYEKDRTRIEIEIERRGEGCAVTLTHAGVFASYAERTRGGWAMILQGLERAII